MAKQWSHGLFGCFDDCGTCIVTFFWPCYTVGKNAEAVGTECYVLCGLATCIPLANVFFMAQIRSKIREQNRIEGTFLNDFMATCCCPLCMLVQSSQEVKESRTVVYSACRRPSKSWISRNLSAFSLYWILWCSAHLFQAFCESELLFAEAITFEQIFCTTVFLYIYIFTAFLYLF